MSRSMKTRWVDKRNITPPYREIGIRLDPGGLVPYDVETGQPLTNVVGCSVDTHFNEIITATITVYIAEMEKAPSDPITKVDDNG